MSHPQHFLLLLIVLQLSLSTSGQAYVDINAGITAVSRGWGAWGDCDSDKDLDLLITGEMNNGQATSRIYFNDETGFTDSEQELPGVINGMALWIDFDNDGQLDIFITGEHEDETSFLLHNQSGSFTTVDHNLGYFGAYSSGSISDFDNDGDSDLFISGDWSSILYCNNGDEGFLETEHEFIGLSSSRSCWVDIDHDQDMDLFVTGDTGGGMKLFVYLNEGNSFTEYELEGMGLSAGSIEFADYDADGDADLLIMGFNDNVEPEANIYRNDGNLEFTNIWAGLPPVALGRAVWGDCDNDGDPDVAITGKLSGCGVFVSDVYENVGNDYFNSQVLNLQSAEYSCVAWGDCDNDTDLDLFICGLSYSGGPFSKIYRNDMSLPNFLPEPPQETSHTLMDGQVFLNWEVGSDVQTASEGLTYNIRLGTSPLGGDVCAPLSHPEDGFRKIPAPGNASQENSWTIKDLEAGVPYFWSVQTIDPTLAASEFSEEKTFILVPTAAGEIKPDPGFSVYPNPASKRVFMRDEEKMGTYEIVTPSGKRVVKFPYSAQPISISELERGLYFVRKLNAENPVWVKMLVL